MKKIQEVMLFNAHCATQKKIQKRQELLLAVFGVLGTNLWPVCSHHPTIFCNHGFNFFRVFIYLRYFGKYDAAFEALILHCFALIVCFVVLKGFRPLCSNVIDIVP